MSNFEDQYIKILRQSKILFEREKTFSDLQFGYYRYDFYIPSLNILIEIDGLQHYKFTKIFYKSRQDFLKAKERDRRKNNYALAHNIPLYRIPYWELSNIKTFQDSINEIYRVKTQYHNDYIKVPKKIDNFKI